MSSLSLKAYTGKLAKLLGTTADAVYERQRMLVRAELLDLGEGRGPGGGTRATAPGLALLLIAVLSTESLSRAETRTHELINAEEIDPPDDSPFKGHRKFPDALAYVITQPLGLARRVIEIEISRTAARAAIAYRDIGGKMRRAEFAGANATEPAVRVTAALDGAALLQIAADVRAMLLAMPDPLFGSEGTRRQLQRPDA